MKGRENSDNSEQVKRDVCPHTYYKTEKENEDSIAHHKCICVECGIELDPITYKPTGKEEIHENKNRFCK